MTVEALVSSFNTFAPKPDEVRSAGLPEPLSRVGIALPKEPLEGTPYTYQVGVSSMTANPNFVEWRERYPDVELTDSKVSGVAVFDGDTVIAGYWAQSNEPRPPWLIGVHPDYRRQGLATLAILQWFKALPIAKLVTWPVNEDAVGAFVSAHKLYIEWALANGDPVPQNVIDSVRAEPAQESSHASATS